VLPKEFLEVKKVKGALYPKFSGDNEIEIAEKVIKIFVGNIGEKLKNIKKNIKKIENPDNYKKVRAFARILENRSVFNLSTDLNPVEVRKYLFSAGVVTTKSEREKRILEAAKKFGKNSDEIERAIYADLDEEKVLSEVNLKSPQELIRHYNLSILQTTLFNCLKLSFWTNENHKRIFSAIKRLGLMYEAEILSKSDLESSPESDSSEVVISLTGPASILKQIRKYGTSFAKVVPHILRSEKWWMKAEILDEFTNRVYRFAISSDDGVEFPDYDLDVDYDSEIEREMSSRLKTSRPDLEILREPDVVLAGDFVFIPDFKLRRANREIYIEIAGFWTADYVRKKVEKIKKANVPMILIAREEFEEYDIDVSFFITFKGRLPYLKVLKAINDYFKSETEITDLLEKIKNSKALNLSEMMEKYNIGSEGIEQIQESLCDTHIRARNYLLRKDYVEELVNRIENISEYDAHELLEEEGACALLEVLGYRVVWDGISMENAKIIKRDHPRD